MYVYYIKVRYCNKELQLLRRRRRWWYISSLPTCQLLRVMYVYYIKVRYCNKELQLSLRRPAAHIIINNNNNIIINNNNNMAAAINLLLSRTIDDGGGGGIYHHYQLAVAEELCRYIILRWDAAICNKELQLMRGSTINCPAAAGGGHQYYV